MIKFKDLEIGDIFKLDNCILEKVKWFFMNGSCFNTMIIIKDSIREFKVEDKFIMTLDEIEVEKIGTDCGDIRFKYD